MQLPNIISFLQDTSWRSAPRLRRRRGSAGFSVPEILLVVGMFAIITSFGLLTSMDAYRGSDFRSDRALLITLLERARMQAMNAICSGSSCTDSLPHGVHIEAGRYVLFQGTAYNATDPENAAFDASAISTHSFTGDIIFSALTATTSADTVIGLASGERASDITVSTEGQITWTN